MKKIWGLFIAVLGNALGTALMSNTKLGFTAWGSAAKNFSNFFNISFGTGFIILALIFYLIALLISKKFVFQHFVFSLTFLLSFGLLSDLLISIIPELDHLNMIFRILINFLGLSILLFSIALHLKINIAVHPCDVFLDQMQKLLKHDAYGTYLTYFIAFMIAISFGLLHGKIEGIHIGTLLTLLLSGLLIRFFNLSILNKYYL